MRLASHLITTFLANHHPVSLLFLVYLASPSRVSGLLGVLFVIVGRSVLFSACFPVPCGVDRSSMSANFLFPSDGALVGSKELLGSPNVVNPTNAVNEPIPTPSSYVDGRGEICNTKISVGDDHKHGLPERINILYTRKGVMRSGDIHANFQCDFVFAGFVEVWTLLEDGSTKKVTYGSKQYVEIPPYTPHIFYFVADTVMAEWWEGRQGSSSEFRAWFYSPYRSLVEQSYSKSSDSPPGKLKRYKEITNVDNDCESECKEKNGLIPGAAAWISISIALSVLSFALGRSCNSSGSNNNRGAR